jgi:hypothetical protein
MVEDKGAVDFAQVREELRIELLDGYAECMGDGLFILFQAHEGKTQSIVLSKSDLGKLVAAS